MSLWNSMTEVQKVAHSMRHGNQYHTSAKAAPYVAEAEAYNQQNHAQQSFGHTGAGDGSRYSPSSGVDPARDNPYGITSIQYSNGLGFSGNPEHFITSGNPYNMKNATVSAGPRGPMGMFGGLTNVINGTVRPGSPPGEGPKTPNYTPPGPQQPPTSTPQQQLDMVDTGQYQSGKFTTAYNASRPAAAPAGPTTPTGPAAGTPYLDAYVRATARSQEEGPVSKTLKKYLDE
jgi:hypothetical protein